MTIKIRKAVDTDVYTFIDFSIKLSEFNRDNHDIVSKYDNYSFVIEKVKLKAEKTLLNRDKNTLILIAELDNKPVGYALGVIYKEDETADNGTGQMGLFDELYIDEAARGFGLGQKLLDEVMKWMKGKGINRVKLHAYSWNDKAKKLYEQNGFKEYAVSFEVFI